MSESLAAKLQQHFGFNDFLPGQRQVIECLLAGRSAAAVFPTGGGKSLCYQLPALELEGLTLVVSPLIALMKDQIDALTQRGVRARRLDSTLTSDEYRQVLGELRGGELDLLYVAPERFNNERFRELMVRLTIALFAVDEAHCISEWGHNFRPDYLKLAGFVDVCGAERVLALTATATDKVLADICASFRIAAGDAVRAPFYRPNLRLLVEPTSAAAREELLEQRLQERAPGSTIVYVTLQRTAELVAERLAAAGLAARAYHAGMKDEERALVQDWFFAEGAAIVVATIAFGMGIDKPDIRCVYHFNLPKSLEGYAQEIGRAGRDGEPSVCEMLVSLDDLNALESFAYGDTPGRRAIARMVEEILSLGADFDLSLYELAARCDIRALVVRTLLTYLELDGVLEGGTPLYSQYQFQPLRSSREILAELRGESREFHANLFRGAKKGRTWFTLDIEAAAGALGCDRSRIVRALDDLHERGDFEVRAKGVRQRYRRTDKPVDVEELVESLHQRVLRRERGELARLREVVDWASLDACQVAALGARFEDRLERPCGHCSWCEREAPVELPPRPHPAISEEIWKQAVALRDDEEGAALAAPRAFVRFLCGVTSPGLTRARLSRHELFGALREVPFADVLERALRAGAGATAGAPIAGSEGGDAT